MGEMDKKQLLEIHNKTIPLVGVFELLASFTFIFTLVSLLSAQHHFFELTSHFKLQYLLGSLFFAAIFLYLKRNWWIVATISCVLVNAIFVLPWYISDQLKTPDSASSLKVMHLNVLSSNTQYSRVLQLMQDEQPDIFIVQEVNHDWQEFLNEQLEQYPYVHIVPRYDNFGIAVLSSMPFETIQQKYWGNLGLPSLLFSFKFSGQLVHLATTHLPPPGSLELYNTRNQQAVDMLSDLALIEQPLILAGDYNMSMWSSDYAQFDATKHSNTNQPLKNTRQGFGVLATWPASLGFFGIPIDHILVSNDFSVVQSYTGSNVGSDHLPLIAILSFNQSVKE